MPLKPTNVPLRVYRFWEADIEAERSEKGLPSTSNRASGTSNQLKILSTSYIDEQSPAEGLDVAVLEASELCCCSVEAGVALICT